MNLSAVGMTTAGERSSSSLHHADPPKSLPGPLVGLMDDGAAGKRQEICFPAAPDLIGCRLYFDGSLSDMMGSGRRRSATRALRRHTCTGPR